MAIKIKGSSVSGRTPLPTDLLERQLAVNTADGYLFTKHSDGTVKDIKVKVADSATTASTCTGNSATVTNGVYTIGDQTIAGVKTFSSSPVVPTPTVGDRTTKVATSAMFDIEFLKNLSEAGWQKLPSGLIIQWFKGSATNATQILNYPIAFPNQVLSFTTGGKGMYDSSLPFVNVYNLGVSNISVRAFDYQNGNNAVTPYITVIGY